MALFNKKIESYLGVDIGAHGIKVVELRKNKNRPQLWTYGILDQDLDIHVSVNEDKKVEELAGLDVDNKNEENALGQFLNEDERIEQYGKLLKILLEKAKVQTRRATSSLPVSQVFHAVINFPKVEEKELDNLVKAEAAKMISRPIEEMQLVYQIIPSSEEIKDKYTRVLVTAAPRKLVAFYTAIFQKAGLQLTELETEAFALARALVGKDKTISMVVDIGAERTNFFIIDSGLPLTHHSLQIGGNNFDKIIMEKMGIGINEAKQIKKDLANSPESIPTETFVRLLEPMVKKIEYSFDLFLKQTGNEGKRPEKIILTGGSAFFPPVYQFIKNSFPLKVFIGDPWSRVIYQDGLKNIIDDIGPRMSVSIGLSLRNFN